jgi:hypothetical protein
MSVQFWTCLIIWRATGSKSQNPDRPLKIYSLKKVIKEFCNGFQVGIFKKALNYLSNFYQVHWQLLLSGFIFQFYQALQNLPDTTNFQGIFHYKLAFYLFCYSTEQCQLIT